jgi:hypothetical protein
VKKTIRATNFVFAVLLQANELSKIIFVTFDETLLLTAPFQKANNFINH